MFTSKRTAGLRVTAALIALAATAPAAGATGYYPPQQIAKAQTASAPSHQGFNWADALVVAAGISGAAGVAVATRRHPATGSTVGAD
jgi:hypothetical protein